MKSIRAHCARSQAGPQRVETPIRKQTTPIFIRQAKPDSTFLGLLSRSLQAVGRDPRPSGTHMRDKDSA